MPLRIGFAYNEKPETEDEPPGTSRPLDDQFAEWDDPSTIAAVEAALARAGDVIRLEADETFPERLRAARPDIVFNIAEPAASTVRSTSRSRACAARSRSTRRRRFSSRP